MSFAVVEVKPTGVRTMRGFACGAGKVLTQWEVPEYPPSPKGTAFWATLRASCTPTEAGRLLGMSGTVVLGLRIGRYVFADPDDWDRAGDLLRRNATR